MKICLVCSHGGHLTEMQQLMDAFEGHKTVLITYSSERTNSLNNGYLIRHRGEKFVYLFPTMLDTILKAINILLKEKVDVIVSTGGEIAIPFCYIGKLLGAKIVYIESLCRITTTSGSGKIIYPIADLFLVQWKSLLKKYGRKAKYWGKVI